MRLLLAAALMLGSSAWAVAPPGAWWNPQWKARRVIRCTSGITATPVDYSHRFTIDHAAIAAVPLGTGEDAPIRVVRWDGSGWVELDRVLDPGSAWERFDTTVWFRAPFANPANDTDSDTYVYYFNTASNLPPDDPQRVFLRFDDFEAPTLDKWSSLGGNWQLSPSSHRGARALFYGPEPMADRVLVASPPLDVADVMVESYWRMSRATDVDVAQIVRFTQPPGFYGTANEVGDPGWDIFSENPTGGFVEHQINRGAPSNDVWTRVSIGIYGSGVRVFQDGVQINPLTGSANVGNVHVRGNVGLDKYIVNPDAGWWVDDFIARKYVDPEPTTSLGPEERLDAVDGGPVTGPLFTTAPSTGLTCGAPWSYEPRLEGATSAQFSIRGNGRSVVPDALKVDATTGRLEWTPGATETGRWVLDLVAVTPQGAVSQPVDLVVTCMATQGRIGCGLQELGGLGLVALVIALLRSRLRADARPAPRDGVGRR